MLLLLWSDFLNYWTEDKCILALARQLFRLPLYHRQNRVMWSSLIPLSPTLTPGSLRHPKFHCQFPLLLVVPKFGVDMYWLSTLYISFITWFWRIQKAQWVLVKKLRVNKFYWLGKSHTVRKSGRKISASILILLLSLSIVIKLDWSIYFLLLGFYA